MAKSEVVPTHLDAPAVAESEQTAGGSIPAAWVLAAVSPPSMEKPMHGSGQDAPLAATEENAP